ncbi:DUF6119 family protein [Pseudoxanthomonas suwonensis]|uniref:DUF6119 family protein n=1 Tax=Pseudoxanthomonas suwonensis TaxID=314722 RepID=UPI00138EF122|nr:DUF6119 family protein [Pseudoxanthomonas suwonensis]KAF1699061.1 hypothetical protein CSC68_15135 [Pseudoxanthomonas suwonensis]
MDFSVYLLRVGINHRSAVRVEADTVVHESDSGVAYIFPSSENTPGWVDEVIRLWPGVNPDALKSSRAGCVLAVQALGRIFLLTFGLGHLKVDKKLVVADFGRRVTINAVDPKTVKQVSRQALEGSFIHAVESAARSGSVRQFGIDIERDLLQGILGRPRKTAFGKAIGGATSLRVAVDGGLSSLISRLPIYLRLYNQKIRCADFDWYERIQVVEDPGEIAQLDAALNAAMGAPGAQILLGIPSLIDGVDQIAGFQFEAGSRACSYPDPEFADWKSWCLTKGLPVNLATAESRKLFVRFSSGSQVWEPIANSIFWEYQSPSGGNYVRHDGGWFKVDAAFVGLVHTFIAGLQPIGSVSLPAYISGHDEAAYNASLSAAIPGAVVLDTKTVTLPNARTALEPCDVYYFDPASGKGILFFVKRKKVGSTGLTHLFAQISVGVDAFFHRDSQYRALVDALFTPPESLGFPPANRPDPLNWTIAIVVCSSRGPRSLPFLSQVSLKRVIESLRLRYDLSFTFDYV